MCFLLDLIWIGLVWFGVVWFELVWCLSFRSSPDPCCCPRLPYLLVGLALLSRFSFLVDSGIRGPFSPSHCRRARLGRTASRFRGDVPLPWGAAALGSVVRILTDFGEMDRVRAPRVPYTLTV